MTAMPDPERLVNRSIAVCKRTGMNDKQAAAAVGIVALETMLTADTDNPELREWLSRVVKCAASALKESAASERRATPATDGVSGSNAPNP
jgi:hypothetical protein